MGECDAMTNIVLSTTNPRNWKQNMLPTKSKVHHMDTLSAIKRPILYFAISTITISIISIMPILMAFDVAFRTGVWATTMTLMAAILLMMGMLLCSVALILFSISKLVTAR